MPVRDYVLHGLRLRSEIPLAAVPAVGGRAPDAELLLGRVVEIPRGVPSGTVIASCDHRDRPGELFYSAIADDGAHLLRIHGVCDLRVDASRTRLVCDVDPRAAPDLVAMHLSGIGIAFVLGLGGTPVLHASAVAAPDLADEVVALGGGSGTGKSTVAALLCAAGCDFVTDDLLRLGFDGDAALSIGGSPELRLRDGAAYVLDAFAPPRPAARRTVDDRLALSLGSGDVPTRRIRAVVVPWPARDLDRVHTRRLDASDALVLLARSPKLEGWVSPSVVKMQFDGLARLVRSVPVLIARIPWAPVREGSGDGRAAGELLADLVRST